MKNRLALSLLFFLIALPALGDLTDADFNRLRLIIREEIDRELKPLKADIVTLKADIVTLKADIVTLKTDMAWVRGKIEGFDDRFDDVNQRITHATNISYGLIALIAASIAIPQVIMAWRSRKDRALEKQIETLAEEIEILKQQQIIRR